ncbi:MAG TPA: DUF3568 family protein [Nitrospirae bacterium]|nr:hypothetical protein BMS3Abin10_00758 [bacterium BMS3Abin10]GBE39854.1 hypothetical protein BMS3Bbin08_02488 [bacterium BMS3Bbin08]HDH51505.1 DUF3568 family protein [Nitrospirota bacterium]HDK80967.1 DUF3568 family protein [Nitrospirota bacterium]HDO25836.1 DUF3568 family protein [Nitrospirota bacterium]
MRQTTRLIGLLLSITLLWGCVPVALVVGAGVGVGTYKYIDGNLEREYPLSFNSAWDATNTSLANLSISISNSVNEGVKGKIEAVRMDGSKITIKLKDKGQGVTTISVRVGFFGSRDEAERIHEEILRVSQE